MSNYFLLYSLKGKAFVKSLVSITEGAASSSFEQENNETLKIINNIFWLNYGKSGLQCSRFGELWFFL